MSNYTVENSGQILWRIPFNTFKIRINIIIMAVQECNKCYETIECKQSYTHYFKTDYPFEKLIWTINGDTAAECDNTGQSDCVVYENFQQLLKSNIVINNNSATTDVIFKQKVEHNLRLELFVHDVGERLKLLHNCSVITSDKIQEQISNTKTIVFSVVGGIVFIIAIVVLACLYIKCKKTRQGYIAVPVEEPQTTSVGYELKEVIVNNDADTTSRGKREQVIPIPRELHQTSVGHRQEEVIVHGDEETTSSEIRGENESDRKIEQNRFFTEASAGPGWDGGEQRNLRLGRNRTSTECIRKNYKFLIQELDAGDIVDYMFQQNGLSYNDMQEVKQKQTVRARTTTFLAKLIESGNENIFDVFIESLQEKYVQVAKILMVTMEIVKRRKQNKNNAFPFNETVTGDLFQQTVTLDNAGTLSERGIQMINVSDFNRNEAQNKFKKYLKECKYKAEEELVFLYHGSSYNNILSILTKGIILRYGRSQQDFSNGYGFYLSYTFDLAKHYAKWQSRKHGVIVYSIARSTLQQFTELCLDDDIEEWRKVIMYCREGYRRPRPERFHGCDYITGPICANPSRVGVREVKPITSNPPENQLCVISEKLADEFNKRDNIACVVFYD